MRLILVSLILAFSTSATAVEDETGEYYEYTGVRKSTGQELVISMFNLWADGTIEQGYPQEWSGRSLGPSALVRKLDYLVIMYMKNLEVNPYDRTLFKELYAEIEFAFLESGFLNKVILEELDERIQRIIFSVIKPKIASKGSCMYLLEPSKALN